MVPNLIFVYSSILGDIRLWVGPRRERGSSDGGGGQDGAGGAGEGEGAGEKGEEGDAALHRARDDRLRAPDGGRRRGRSRGLGGREDRVWAEPVGVVMKRKMAELRPPKKVRGMPRADFLRKVLSHRKY